MHMGQQSAGLSEPLAGSTFASAVPANLTQSSRPGAHHAAPCSAPPSALVRLRALAGGAMARAEVALLHGLKALVDRTPPTSWLWRAFALLATGPLRSPILRFYAQVVPGAGRRAPGAAGSACLPGLGVDAEPACLPAWPGGGCRACLPRGPARLGQWDVPCWRGGGRAPGAALCSKPRASPAGKRLMSVGAAGRRLPTTPAGCRQSGPTGSLGTHPPAPSPP